jgi:hypothetical protein
VHLVREDFVWKMAPRGSNIFGMGLKVGRNKRFGENSGRWEAKGAGERHKSAPSKTAVAPGPNPKLLQLRGNCARSRGNEQQSGHQLALRDFFVA